MNMPMQVWFIVANHFVGEPAPPNERPEDNQAKP